MTTVGARPGIQTRSDWEPLGNVASLDGLRAIAVIVVVAYHGGWFGIDGGFIGVDLFFVLSGFLITRLLIDEQHRRGGISLRRFYIRRALRLLPALFALVIAVWTFAAVLDAPRLEDRLVPRSLWALSYVANWHDVATQTHGGPFSHLWSLSVEEQFYVIWPIVVVALLRTRGEKALRHTAAGISISLAVLTAVRFWTGASSGMTLYFGTDSHGAILLLAGSWLGANRSLLNRLDAELARLLLIAGVAGFAVFALAEGRFNTMHLGAGYVPITVISLMAVAGAVHHRDAAWLTWEPLRQIGRSSYAIYLWHIPMFTIGAALAPGMDPRIRIILGTAIATTLSHWLIERPALRQKHRWA